VLQVEDERRIALMGGDREKARDHPDHERREQ
jgi:hypothetical protein